MARKLYAVTSGGEDEYHIITLTKSRRRAEKIAEMYGARVEAYVDGEPVEVFRRKPEKHEEPERTWLAKHEGGKIYVIPESSKTRASSVLFGCRIFIKAPVIEEAMKIATFMFADYDLRRSKGAAYGQF
jgi:hypothetical protein